MYFPFSLSKTLQHINIHGFLYRMFDCSLQYACIKGAINFNGFILSLRLNVGLYQTRSYPPNRNHTGLSSGLTFISSYRSETFLNDWIFLWILHSGDYFNISFVVFHFLACVQSVCGYKDTTAVSCTCIPLLVMLYLYTTVHVLIVLGGKKKNWGEMSSILAHDQVAGVFLLCWHG